MKLKSSMELESISTFCLPGVFLDLEVLAHFGLTNAENKNCHNLQKVWIISSLFNNFLCQTVLIFPRHIFFTKIIETFWSRDVTDIWVLAHFELRI